MTSETQKLVEQANADFYKALEAASQEKMDQVWLHEDWVACIHPGWEMIKGWTQIREAWDRIFENRQKMRVSADHVAVQVIGDLAWVTCTENITAFYSASFESMQAVATNLFVRMEDRWLMAHHHASPIPSLIPDAATDIIQ
jgi:uncharacterized protein (TIGR02246 family)